MFYKFQNYLGEILEVFGTFSHTTAGLYGWKVEFSASFLDQSKDFEVFETNEDVINAIQEAKANGASIEEVEKLYADKFIYKMEENIIKWATFVKDTKGGEE